MEEQESKFVTCPNCGRRAIKHLNLVKNKLFYLCPFCGSHGEFKLIKEEPMEEENLTLEDDNSEAESDNNTTESSESPFVE